MFYVFGKMKNEKTNYAHIKDMESLLYKSNLTFLLGAITKK